MSINFYDTPAPVAPAGPIDIQVNYEGWHAPASVRATVVRGYAEDVTSTDVAVGWLAHALRKGLHKSPFALPEVAYYAVSVAVAHGLGDKLTGGAALSVDIETGGNGA